MSSTVIVDYGMGNLRSVQKAFERVGEPAEISGSAATIAAATRLILPGVGAFRDAIASLRQHGLIGVVRDHILADRPFLGICLGMQLLLEVSCEDGEHAGLGIIPGTVRRFDLPPEYKIPHMGWNRLQPVNSAVITPLFSAAAENAWYYFVHSYYVDPADAGWIACTTDYGRPFVSAVARGNVFATQFHPEKSQAAGLQLLRNFVAATSPDLTSQQALRHAAAAPRD